MSAKNLLPSFSEKSSLGKRSAEDDIGRANLWDGSRLFLIRVVPLESIHSIEHSHVIADSPSQVIL